MHLQPLHFSLGKAPCGGKFVLDVVPSSSPTIRILHLPTYYTVQSSFVKPSTSTSSSPCFENNSCASRAPCPSPSHQHQHHHCLNYGELTSLPRRSLLPFDQVLPPHCLHDGCLEDINPQRQRRNPKMRLQLQPRPNPPGKPRKTLKRPNWKRRTRKSLISRYEASYHVTSPY